MQYNHFASLSYCTTEEIGNHLRLSFDTWPVDTSNESETVVATSTGSMYAPLQECRYKAT